MPGKRGSGVATVIIRGLYSTDQDYLDLKVDSLGRIVLSDTITIENVNVIAPLGVTVDDGADVALGTVGDSAWTTGDGTVIGLLKAIHAELVTANGLLTDIKTNTA
jgi:hypothetical protein